MIKKYFFVLLFCICILGGLFRSYRIDQPVADWHSFRQVDTASVARNFIKNGLDPLRPRYHDLSNIQSGSDNPMGWRMVEFPLYQILSVFLVQIFPFLGIDLSLRIISLIASVGSVFLVGILVRKYGNELSGLLSAFFFAVLPFSVFYGRVILPEPLTVFLSLFALVLAIAANNYSGLKNTIFLISSAVIAALALLTKPFAGFLLMPLAFVLLERIKLSPSSLFLRFLYAGLTLIPLYLWRQWIQNFPEGIPVSGWLFNEGNIRFKGAWFYWLFGERIAKLIFGYWGTALFSLGLAAKSVNKGLGIFSLLLLGTISYLVVIARGNVQHDYYQVLILPVLCIFLGLGLELLLKSSSHLNRAVSSFVGVICVILMCAFSWYYLRSFYWINNSAIIEAGKVADQLLPGDAKVIAPYNGDTTFLYQTKRNGWPLGFDIEKKIAQGATHYVTVSPTDNDLETKDLSDRYTVIMKNEKFAIIDLTKLKGQP